jgi:hypothetical protein
LATLSELRQRNELPNIREWRDRPTISYWKSGDPCNVNFAWVPQLTEINVILTKRLSDDFVEFCIREQARIYLHVNITGMGKTTLEPNIPSVKETFFQLAKLIRGGFPAKQVLVFVNPVLSNDNGLRALELLLRVFTEFKILRLRNLRVQLLSYRYADDKPQPEYLKKKGATKYMVANNNINKRPSTKGIMPYLIKTESFTRDYYKLLKKYEAILTVDKGEESLIGVRELLPFGLNNSWTERDGTITKLITYENNNRWKPIVNVISATNPIRCQNACLLCPFRQ